MIILTKDESFAAARKAVQAENVLDYLPKSMDPRRFLPPIESALIKARHRGLVELHRRSQVDVPPRIVGRSAAAASIREAIERAASVDSTVLVTGETGAGKEVVARHIHLASARRAHPFVVVNCPVLHDELVQSELFGHVIGAFTGAGKSRRGQIELAAKVLESLNARLTDTGRTIFDLLIIRGLADEEVAALQGLSRDAILQWRSRLRKRIEKTWTDLGGTEDA